MDVFGGAPRFLAYPRPVVVQSGTDAVLKCQIGGDPRPAVIWERNNEKIHPEGRYRLFEDGNVYNLIITSVTVEDSGQYICKAKNCIGETYAAATLKVEGEAQEMEFREENKPRFLIKPLSTRVGRGEDAVFSCKLWGNPRPEVMWEKDGKKLNEIFESTHFAISYQDGGWFQLKIFKTRAPDGGVYTCKARNEFGESLAGAVLLVDAGPGHEDEGNHDPLPNSAKVKMFAVTEGKHAKFRCYVTGKPKPEILWRKDGRLILSGRRYLLYEDREGYFTLKVLYCKQQDNGVYVCSASNTAGQTLSAVHLIVKDPPVRFKQPLNDLQVWERDLAVLECEVPEDSVPITWYLEDRRLQPGAKYGMEEWGTKRRLTIRDIGVDDDGIYLCEMADGGRSIAEVTVKGTIVRKLPRKVDVLEGENAAFCVEVEEEEMDIHWYKDGTELRETHQTILKSFGRTHILVFVNTTPQDSGLVMFYVGRSKTSSQLRVKAARHCPPSCPIGVQINTERANAALLSWFPAQDSRKNPPSGYIIERQEVVSQEWLQCLTTDSATSVEILGDSVPCEADYRFRICSVNKYGRSGNVEFPRAVHLVPVARIQAPLQDALVPEGQDACFTIELSASVIGTWFLNGNQLQDDERFSIRRSRTHQSLRIRGVRDTDNGAEITFIAYGIRDSAALYIQGKHLTLISLHSPLVKFTPLSEMDRNKFVEVALQCELSDPLAQVSWYKDGVKLLPQSGLDFKSKGTERQMIVQTAEFDHSGVYSCKTRGDAVHFNVDVKAPKTNPCYHVFIQHPFIEAGCPIILQCEISDPTAQVSWLKDGVELQDSGLDIQSEGTMRKMIIQSAELKHSGMYSCEAVDDRIAFKVDVAAPPVTFAYIPEADLHRNLVEQDNLLLCCQVSRSDATAQWYKDGVELKPCDNVLIEVENTIRRLIILSAQLSDSGTYTCRVHFDVMLTFAICFPIEPPVRIVSPSQSQMELCQQTSERMVLSCEISRPNATVRWYRDGLEVEESDSLILEVDGVYRRLIIPKPTVKDSAEYVCDTADDSVTFFVNIAGVKMAYGVEKLVGDTVVLECEVSRPNAEVSWKKDGESDSLILEVDGVYRRLIIPKPTVKDSAEYVCDTADDSVTFFVNIAEPPVRFIRPRKMAYGVEKLVGDTVVLECEVSRPNAEVSWKKDGVEIEENSNITTTEDGTSRQLTIHSAAFEDAGQYVCDARDDVMDFLVKIKVPRIVEFIAELHNITVMEGEDATFKCVVSPEDAKLAWFRNGQPISSNEKFIISSNGLCHMLHITNCQVSDSCKLTAEAEGVISRAILQVQEAQVLFTKSMGPVVAEEFGEATIEVEVSHETAEVRWMRQGVVIHPGSKFTLKQNGKKRSLTIHKLTLSDRGTYSCETLHDRTQAKLTVERESAHSAFFLTVELSHSNVEGVWQKDGHILKNNNRLRMTAKGRVHSLTISNLNLDDTGTYIFSVDNIRSIARLEVKEIPVSILKKLEDIRQPEGSGVTLECELSRHNVDIKWTKNDVQLKPGKNHRIYSMGRKCFLQILKCELGDSGLYMCDAGDATTSCTVDIYGNKRKSVRLSPHLSADYILYLPEGQNAVFMCEVSLDDVPGQWFKNGEKIKPTSTIKIRQEGTKHFLLICNVKEDDSGEIKFVAKNLETTACLEVEALPANIVKPLQDKTALEKTRVILDCTVTNPRCSIRWYKGPNVILPSERFEICSEGCYRKLVIPQVLLEDEGTYSVQVGNYTSSAKLTVEGKANSVLSNQL
uniref:Obscurin-like protein 1 n=1 Tax=Sinocyclocheilus grahami TaxID=75366 RepID=A0A672M6N7_SINGR